MAPLPEDHQTAEYDSENLIVPDTSPDQTSYSDDSMFSDSSTSHHTTSTIESREVANYFRSVFGFPFSSDENVPMMFPMDSTADRLDVLLHVIVRLCQGGKNVSEAVDKLLRKGGVDGLGAGARVLDMVTNSGTCCRRVNEMAGIYSTARFVSVDTKPLVSHKPHPRIDFQVYSFYDGILEPDASFDVVHLRQGVFATKNFDFLLKELHRVLKPDGYIMITELPTEAYEGPSPGVIIHSAPYMAEAVKLVHKICEIESVDMSAWQDMRARLVPSHPLWDNRPLGSDCAPSSSAKPENIERVKGFCNIDQRAEPVPLGAWHPDETQKILGGLARLWSLHHAYSALPTLTLRGIQESRASEFKHNLLQELTDVDRYRAYLICRMWSAKKL